MEEGISDESKKEVEKTIKLLEENGNKVVEVSLPLTKMALSIYYLIAPAECSANLSRFDGVRYGIRKAGATSYEMMENTRAEGFGEEVKKNFAWYLCFISWILRCILWTSIKSKSAITKDFENIFKEVDYLISPTTPTPAFKFGEKTENPLEMYMSDLCTIPANLAGFRQ